VIMSFVRFVTHRQVMFMSKYYPQKGDVGNKRTVKKKMTKQNRPFVVTRCAYCGDIITRSGNRHWDICSKCEDVVFDVK